jgi:hypothetical protein
MSWQSLGWTGHFPFFRGAKDFFFANFKLSQCLIVHVDSVMGLWAILRYSTLWFPNLEDGDNVYLRNVGYIANIQTV